MTTRQKPSAAATVGGITTARGRWARHMVRALLVVGVVLTGWTVARKAGLDPSMLLRTGPKRGFVDVSLQSVLSRDHMAYLRQAIEVYRAENGEYPPGLYSLVDGALVRDVDLKFPWMHEYFYQKDGTSYVLLRPVY